MSALIFDVPILSVLQTLIRTFLMAMHSLSLAAFTVDFVSVHALACIRMMLYTVISAYYVSNKPSNMHTTTLTSKDDPQK